MSMQTKIAFKVDELKRKAKDAKNNKVTDNEKEIIKQKNDNIETKEIDSTDDEKEEEKEEEKEDFNPFFREPLYIGNLCLPSSTDKYYRWIVFISTSSSEIIKPKSISSVTYVLHPTHPNPKQTKTKSPFFLDISGWGIFQIDITITFKNNFIRPCIETAHMLSVDSQTSITCVEDGTHQYHPNLWKYQHFKQFKNEKKIDLGKISFVQKVKRRLKRNLLKTPTPVYFDGFKSRLPQFKAILKQCITSDDRLSQLKQLNIPDIIYDVIAYFAVFAVSLYDILPNQEMFIEDCQDCDIVISAPKFNHLRLRRCDNITLKFTYIMSKCELIECNNVQIICSTGMCYTYRFDECNTVNVRFLDRGRRVTFLCFNAPNVSMNVSNIEWKEARQKRLDIGGDDVGEEEAKYNEYDKSLDLIKFNDKDKYPDSLSYCVPFEKGEKERLSVRWRSYKIAEWSWKVFHAKYTMGSVARRS